MLRAHEALLLNWFRGKGEISAGAVEGLNNKMRVVTRRSYGFRTHNAMEMALYRALGRPSRTGISPQILLRRRFFFVTAFLLFVGSLRKLNKIWCWRVESNDSGELRLDRRLCPIQGIARRIVRGYFALELLVFLETYPCR